MSRYLSKTKTASGPATHGSRRKRIKEEQRTHKITFETDPSSEFKRFEETVSGLYGIPGIGKSRFAYDLGLVLQEKYSLKYPGVYVLQCEPINHPWKIRKTHIPTWPTFRKFIDDVSEDKKFIKTVKMWVLDTIDALVPKGISTICHDLGVIDLKDATIKMGDSGWNAVAWKELRNELLYQVLRLHQLGPGVLILSHERNRPTTDGRLTYDKPSMDLSGSVYNAIGDRCSMIFRMRSSGSKGGRCLVCLGSNQEDAKDNLNKVSEVYEDGIIKFKTEKQAVRKILDCFDSKASRPDKFKSLKKSKKSKKSKRRRS